MLLVERLRIAAAEQRGVAVCMVGVLTGFSHLMPYTRPAMLKNMVAKNERDARTLEYSPPANEPRMTKT